MPFAWRHNATLNSNDILWRHAQIGDSGEMVERYRFSSGSCVECRMQCALDILRSTFFKWLIKGTPWLAHEGEAWVVFCEFEVLLSKLLCCVQFWAIIYRDILGSFVVSNNKTVYYLPWITNFGHLQCDSPMMDKVNSTSRYRTTPRTSIH